MSCMLRFRQSIMLILLLLIACVSSKWVKEMENHGLYEGDMVLTPTQLIEAKQGKLTFATTLMPKYPHKIYYDWDPDLANNRGILAAIDDYHKFTCLRFEKRTNQHDYIYFFRGSGCSSGVGYAPGKQTISIGHGCDGKGTVLHEIAHRLGILHEQSRPDRDNYVEIKFENINKNMAYNFHKQDKSAVDSLGTAYDYLSIMHYPDWAFSSNGQPTIITKDPSYQKKIGNRLGFSPIDIIQINRMYKCGPVTTLPPVTPPTGVEMFTLRHTSGKCLSVDTSDKVIFTSTCNTNFYFKNDHLMVVGTGKCMQLAGVNDNANVIVSTHCVEKFALTNQNANYFALENIESGKCVHPYNGPTNPAENTVAVIYSGCDLARIKFEKTTFIKKSAFSLLHTAGKCLSVGSDNILQLTSPCTTKFTIENGKLFLDGTSMCAQPTGNGDNAYVTMQLGCTATYDFSNLNSEFFSIENRASGKCFHPLNGAPNPRENTKIVQYSGCDENRLKFKKI